MSLNEFGTAVKPQTKESGQPERGEEAVPAEREKEKSGDKRCWSPFQPGQWLAASSTIPTLRAGAYTVNDLYHGNPVISELEIKIDDLLEFPDSAATGVCKEISEFWNRGKYFRHHGFLHRRGYLFYGPAGSGKTALVQQIIADIIRKGDIVFVCSRPHWLIKGLVDVRAIEPDRRIVCVFEDIDSIISKFGDEELLKLLDGECQLDKVLNIATTNYPERLDRRIVARPRRFDRVVKIDMPCALVRRDYFLRKLKLQTRELDKWVRASENFSFAALAEMVISVKCLGNSFESTVETLKENMQARASSKEFDQVQIGFERRNGHEREDDRTAGG